MKPDNIQLKVTIAKLIQVAYSVDKGLTTKILRKVGRFTLTVDQDGNARLSGQAGVLSFSGSEVIDTVTTTIKFISVSFKNTGDGDVKYIGIINFKVAKVSITGKFNVEELITSCSGLLCIAARLLRDREKDTDDKLQKYNRATPNDFQLQRIMGH